MFSVAQQISWRIKVQIYLKTLVANKKFTKVLQNEDGATLINEFKIFNFKNYFTNFNIWNSYTKSVGSKIESIQHT